jgi:hypothetical protein
MGKRGDEEETEGKNQKKQRNLSGNLAARLQ